jgi:hypothetical protein
MDPMVCGTKDERLLQVEVVEMRSTISMTSRESFFCDVFPIATRIFVKTSERMFIFNN